MPDDESGPEVRRERANGIALALALGGLVLLVAATPRLYAPPDPEPLDAPATVFSAERALEVLWEVAGGGEPRPAGSAANARVRRALVDRFERLGYETELQETFACGAWGSCAPIANLLAWRPGEEAGTAVLFMAHYDTVAAGPGAADNGSGVAILLESARVLAESPRSRHPILFLITDGEELGLLGAEVFLSDHPWASRVGAVVNVEARGSGGPSVMFETGPGNLGTVRLFAGAARRPVTSSLFDAIYQRLPNDTDFTPFKALGLPGLNFAFVGHPLRYHTREDRLDNLDAGSLQQQGANALASARALAASDLSRLPRGDAVFFDLLSRGVVTWRAGWNQVLALAALGILGAFAWRGWRAGGLRLRHLLMGPAGLLVAPSLAWAAALGAVSLARRAGASPGDWVAAPRPLILAFWLLAATVATLLATIVAWRMPTARTGLWAGTWLAWGLLALLFAAMDPGEAYLYVLPALAAGLIALPRLRSGRAPDRAWTLLPVLVAAPLWFPILWFLYDGMGLPMMPLVAALVAFLLWGLAPALPRRSTRAIWALPLGAGAATLLCLGLAMARAPYTPDQPRPLNILLVQDGDSGRAVWAAGASEGPPPARLAEAAGFSDAISRPIPWAPRFDAFTAEAPALAVEPPSFTLIADRSTGNGRRLRGWLHSPRGARSAGLAIPAGTPVESVRVNGRRIPDERVKAALDASGDARRIEVWAIAAEGVEVELVLGSPGPLAVVVFDESTGLPAAGLSLLDARPPTLSPIGRGDRTILFRSLEL